MESDGNTWLRGPLIGRGVAGSSVYKATAKKPNPRGRFHPHVMAVKSAEISLSASLQKEKQVLSNLSQCSNVLRCFGEETTFGRDGSMIYNVLLEYAPAGTLASLIKNSPGAAGLPESEVRHYAKFLVRGIHQVHERGYVHCDLKPDNVLLFPSGKTTTTASPFVAKIGDFGSAKRARQTKKTKWDPYLRGTIMYMAPETVVHQVQEPPSDIWALGCIVLEMLTGQYPWDLKADYKKNDLLRLIRNPYQKPKIPTTGISKEARQFLKGCFVRDPKIRPTVEKLMAHPFLSCEDDKDRDIQERQESPSSEEEVSWSSSSFDASDSELSSSFWSEDFEDSDRSSTEEVTCACQKRKRESSNFIVITDAVNLIYKKPKAPSNAMHQSTVPTIHPAVKV